MADRTRDNGPFTLGRVLAGVAVAAAAGAAIYYARERRTESPVHETIISDGAFELRRYPALLVAEAVRFGDRAGALRSAFGALADYIFAESREGDAIAMTAPVLAAPTEEGALRVRFVMPAIWTRATLPAPNQGVEIDELPARRVAVIRFGGRVDDALLARKEAELRDWMATQGLVAAQPAEQAYYNSPATPGPLRRNEVLIQIA